MMDARTFGNRHASIETRLDYRGKENLFLYFVRFSSDFICRHSWDAPKETNRIRRLVTIAEITIERGKPFLTQTGKELNYFL